MYNGTLLLRWMYCYNRELLTYCAGGPFSVCLVVRVWWLVFLARYIGVFTLGDGSH